MHCRFAKGILSYTLLLSPMFLDMVKLQQEATHWLSGLEMQTSLHPVQGILKSITYHIIMFPRIL